MQKLYGSIMNAAGRAIPVAEQYTPANRPQQYVQAVAALKSSYAEAQALASKMRKEHSAQELVESQEARVTLAQVLGGIREFAREAVTTSLPNGSEGLQALFRAPDEAGHLNAFISNARKVLEEIRSHWQQFVQAGAPQDLQTKLEKALNALVSAREKYNAKEGERRDARNKFVGVIDSIRRQMRVISAMLKVYYGTKHDSLSVFKEMKRVYVRRRVAEVGNTQATA